MKSQPSLADQKGMAIVVSLLLLLVLSILGVTLMGISLTESHIGSNESDLKIALFAAEAGIQEGMYRMRLDPGTLDDEGDTACGSAADPAVIGFVQGGALAIPSADPGSVSFWKYNPFTTPSPCSWTYSGSNTEGYGNYLGGTAANLNSAGRSFRSSGGAHAGGAPLGGVNLANGGSYDVTVAPVVGYVGGCWQYVDQIGAPLGSCASPTKNPMFKVTSTGTARNARKVLSTMIRRFNVDPKLDGTLTANTNINVESAATVIDGHNYDCDGNNPSDTNSIKAATTPSGASGITLNKPENLQCTAGTGVTDCGGTSSTFPNTLGALLLGPGSTQLEVDVLNTYLESIKIDPPDAPISAFHGVLYVNGDYQRPPDGSTGVLIVHNATNNAILGNFNTGTFKGLIIADSINKINGSTQIIGGIVGFGSGTNGVTVDDVTGTPGIRYSKCIIESLLQDFPFQIVSGTWHEQ